MAPLDKVLVGYGVITFLGLAYLAHEAYHAPVLEDKPVLVPIESDPERLYVPEEWAA